MVCVDLDKAYDRVDRELLWRVLRAYGVNGELIRAVRSLYDDGKACVRVQGQKSDWFGVGQRVRQGCTMSPWIFNIFMDNIVQKDTFGRKGKNLQVGQDALAQQLATLSCSLLCSKCN